MLIISIVFVVKFSGSPVLSRPEVLFRQGRAVVSSVRPLVVPCIAKGHPTPVTASVPTRGVAL